MHWDHAGNLEKFPKARIHLQAKEMHFATGPLMEKEFVRRSLAVEDVCGMVRRLYDGLLTYHDGESELAPGIQLRHVGGHTLGLQIVRVHTRRGWVVLASDAAHYYENMSAPNPFPVILNVAENLLSFDIMRRWVSTANHIVP